MILCRHKLDIVQPDGYQYCKKCGLAFLAPKVVCEHKWVKDSKIEHETWGKVSGITIILQCSDCGELSSKQFGYTPNY